MPGVKFSEPIPVSSPSEATWYQYFEWPDGTTTRGRWDYRGSSEALLGRQDYSGRSVLEIGPASGFLTKEMETRGAGVTCIDVSDDELWELVPRADVDLETHVRRLAGSMPRLRKSWWYSQRQFDGHARMAYIGAAALKTIDARFDFTLISCVLQHMRHPVDLLFDVARLADRVVVTEPIISHVERAGMAELYPTPENESIDSWWLIPSSMVASVMELAGFAQISHERSIPRRWELATDEDATDSYTDREFYTSVFVRRDDVERAAPVLNATNPGSRP